MIPDKVKIGGLIYKCDTTKKSLIIGDKANHTGIIHYAEGLIEISSETCENYQGQTWWHEVLHAICHDRAIKFGDDEEDIIDRLASGIYALMSDNDYKFPGQKEGESNA
jgi:hypothetical protein